MSRTPRRFDQQLGRRAFLRGAGGAIVMLPLADFSLRAGQLVAAEANAEAPRRLFTMFFPNGADPAQWNFQAALAPLAPLQAKLLPIFNIVNPAARETNLPEGHGSGAATAFTGAPAPAADPKHLSGGPTLDQFAAQQLKPPTLAQTLVFGLCSQSAHHTDMFGVHCFARSWSDEKTYVPPLKNPLDIFNALFGERWKALVEVDEKQRAYDKSVLDTVLASFKTATSERGGLGKRGRAKLEDHLDALRDLEKASKAKDVAIKDECRARPAAPAAAPAGIPHEQWDDIFRIQCDLMVSALKCDIVRFGHISFGESAEYYRRADIGPKSGHEAAHDSDVALYLAYVQHHMALFGELFTKLDAVPDSDGRTLLDNTVLYVATELGNQAQPAHHTVDPTVVLLAGGTGRLPVGKIIAGDGHSINDAHVAALKATGVDVNAFGAPGHNRSPIT